MRLKLQYDEPFSNFAFKFNLRRYNPGVDGGRCTDALIELALEDLAEYEGLGADPDPVAGHEGLGADPDPTAEHEGLGADPGAGHEGMGADPDPQGGEACEGGGGGGGSGAGGAGARRALRAEDVVWPGRYCPPRNPTHFETSFF